MECENNILEIGEHKGQGIALVTSGGDSQGMNPAVRAVVRVGLYIGCKVFYIKEGFQGMIVGGNNIIEASWGSVSSIIHKGGTIIGTARSEEFRTFEGKLKCVKNLVHHGISNLIVIGGDGSLTGARELRQMWPDLIRALTNSGNITEAQAKTHKYLKVVGLIGTIDNDFPGTNMTIGTDSALHRILEAVNAVASTAYSHRRTFILEVMGRHCGYLALRTALTTEADYLFLPEMPPTDDWPEDLEKKIRTGSQYGKRLHLIILAEGAINQRGEPITSEMVRQILVNKLGLDARVTVLGHVQRGGSPSAFDRILGSRSGAEAVMALMDLKPEDEPVVVALDSNELKRLNLSECIKKIEKIKKGIDNRDFETVLRLRERTFLSNFEVFRALNKLEPTPHDMNFKIGTPACGMNAAVFSFVRHCVHRGGTVYGVFGGMEGLLNGNLQVITWSDVNGLVFEGGSYLGTKRVIPTENMYPKIAKILQKFSIEGLLIIGGFEGFLTAREFQKLRSSYEEFCIPIALIPATINNNVPGTEFSIGSDTALNTITKSCDLFRQSAMGTKSRVFVVETMGSRCGYLCTMGGLASGADAAYIFEEPFNIDDLRTDVKQMISKMKYGGVPRGLILRNEECNENYTTDFITRIFSEEGKGVFSARKSILGHIQQGDVPSSFDRSLGVKLSSKAAKWFYEQFELSTDKNGKIFTLTSESVAVIGLYGNRFCKTPFDDLISHIDFENRYFKCKWWMNLRPLLKVLALHESNYEHVKKNSKTG